MDRIILKNINLNSILLSTSNLLSIKELLNKINYNLDNLFIDRFWDNIQDDKWIYLDNELILWLGYKELNKGKENIIRLLKKYNIENEDYKILNNTEFDINNFCSPQSIEPNINEEKRGAHNKQYITMSPDCFKELCMYIGTNKSKEIKKYYIELEKVFKFYLDYQNKYKNKQLENINQTLYETIINNKLDKHKMLIEKFRYKQCIYVIEVNIDNNDKKLIKIGSTKKIHDRIHAMNTAYSGQCILLDIYECENNYREIEQYILTHKDVKNNLYKEKINNVMPKEIIELSDKFNYDQLQQIIQESIKKNVYLTPVQLLEKQKMDLINKLLDKGYNPNLFENFTITIITKDKVNNNNIICSKCSNESKHNEKKIETVIQNFYDNKENNNENVEETKEDNITNEENEHNISFRIKKARGRKIQKINPNNLDVVVKVYDSMIYLLRANEGVKYLKSGIQDAIRNNSIYKGYRWCFVEKGEDPMISKAKPTNTNIIPRIVEPIVKINMNKDEIIDIYPSQEQCFLNNGLTKYKLRELIINQELYHNVYFMKISDCSDEILEKYNLKNDEFTKKTRTKPIIAINPLTKEEIIFNTISEIPYKLGGTCSSINTAIQNKTIYNGYYWKIK